NVYSGGQLGEEGELIDGVNDGTVDASIVSPGLMDDYSDLFGIETMPYVFDDWDHADKVLNGEVGEIMKDDLLENSNIRLLGYLHFGFRNLLTTEGNEVKSVEDMEGLDVRSPESWVWTQMFKEWGANPTPVTLGEAYSSVQTGVVDGLENPASVNTDNKYYEVTDNLTLTEHMFGTINFVINNDTYESLSE